MSTERGAVTGLLNIYAWNVNTGGGAVLLDRLAETAQQCFDEVRVYADPKNPSPYLRNIGAEYVSDRWSALVLGEPGARNIYFGNVPPLKRTPNSVLYVHSPYVAQSIFELLSSRLALGFKLKHVALTLFLKAFHRNVERVCCQTASMQDALDRNHGISADLLPFYPPVKVGQPQKKQFDLCYVGLPSAHKNHGFLLDVVEHLASNTRVPLRLAVTVPELPANRLLLDRIAALNESGSAQIVNHGLVPHHIALDIYRQSLALVFPSKLETYGLPLIEAALLGIPVFCPSLPYANDVLKDYVTIDLSKPAETAQQIRHFLANTADYAPPTLRMPDMIDMLLRP